MRRRVVCLAARHHLTLRAQALACPLSRCLPTPLEWVPVGKWLCPACVIWLVERSGLEVEGVKGLVIWLWYPLHAQHHRAVVDGVHTELQGGRLGSVTKVHVRFEAEPGGQILEVARDRIMGEFGTRRVDPQHKSLFLALLPLGYLLESPIVGRL